MATGRLCEPGRWNASAGRANGTKEEIRSFNAYLDDLQKKVYEIHRQLSETGAEITAESLKKTLSGKAQKSITLMQVFKDHNRKVRVLVGKDFAAGTIERYETSLKHTQNYLKWKYQTDDIDVKKIDHEFITNYDFYLRSERKCANNSTVKYLKNFKKIIRICIASGWIDKDPFLNYKVKLKRVDRIFLSQEELDTISNKEFSSERLGQVRDIFLFCCYTGLAYADIKKLRRNEIDKGIDGEMWIVTFRQKTLTPTRVPLLPRAFEIIEKYKDNPLSLISGKAFPVSSNQKMNEYLKEMAVVCHINKNLTFHIARHTFATTVTLSNGVPIESVSKMLGHTNIKTTQHYAKILDMKVSKDMAALKQKFC